jgi:hypothetical protein
MTRLGSSQKPATFIVPMWATFFGLLGKISVFVAVRAIIPWLRHPDRAYVAVEVWVLAHTTLALLATVLVYHLGDLWFLRVLLLYGALRVFEITVYQVNVLFFDEWRAVKAGRPYALRGYRRIVLLLLHNYAEILFWFMAVLVALYQSASLSLTDASPFGIFSAGIGLMTAYSAGAATPQDMFAATVLAVQSLIGIFMTLLTLARFVSLLPTPQTMEPGE